MAGALVGTTLMSLAPLEFRPFPLAAISPKGWLERQLRIQADGLSGHLDEFWPDIRDSAWIGGQAEGWERMPYWLDGVIPLAWLLRDRPLQQRIDGYLDYILLHQHEDGWLGPRIEQKREAADVWSQALALKMLVTYHDATGDDRVPGAVERALRMLDRHIDGKSLSQWGLYRWFEFLVAIWWLYERTEQPWLLDLAVKLQAQGFDWRSFFARWPMKDPTPRGRWNLAGHVVNNAMAIKSGPLWWRLTGDDADRRAAAMMINLLDRHHGMATGVFTGDECLAGLDPTQGTELCAVVEYMYSLECLLSILGEAVLADRLEMIAYNALPAACSPDMWSHQYDQQVNQIECSICQHRPWTTNGPDSNIFGLEPHFGCCTANFSQGWPKFAASLWMREGADTIVAMAYAPSRLDTGVSGFPVTIDLQTGYPFADRLEFVVTTAETVRFKLRLRIPHWCETPTLEVADRPEPCHVSGGFVTIDRSWAGTTRVVLTLPMTVRAIPRPRGAIALARGPLVLALPIGERWQQVNRDLPHREPPHADWEIHPTTPWNYALIRDGESAGPEATVVTKPLSAEGVFSPDRAPVTVSVPACRVAAWQAVNGSAGPVPASPVDVTSPPELVRLIPYGCTNLRIAEFPWCRSSGRGIGS